MHQVQLSVTQRDDKVICDGAELFDELRMVTIDKKLKDFYVKSGGGGIMEEHVIQYVDIWEEKKGVVVLMNEYGSRVDKMSQFQYEQLQKQQFLEQMLDIFVKSADLKPQLLLKDIIYLENYPIKIMPICIAPSGKAYVNNFKQIIQKIYASNKAVMARCKKVTQLIHIQAWKKQLRPKLVQGISISQLLKMKSALQKKPGPKIQFTPKQQQWVFQTVGIYSTPKMQQVYDGASHLFDPQPFIKAINKRKVIILIQSTSRKRIAFLPGFKIDHKPNGIFGNYQQDKQCKSFLFSLNNHSSHPLRDPQHALGLGTQLLLSIGNCDIVLSAFNISNVCMFPVSYQCEEGTNITADQMIGRQFVLNQLEAWSYDDVQDNKDCEK